MSKDPLKVIVRLLPPEITEEELLGTISQTHVQRTKWRSFAAGKRYKGEAKPSVNSRCYFQFETFEYAEDFIKDYHGHQFIDGQGEQFRAVACFAPYQKVPRAKPQKDPREGTIADDPAYKEFVEKLSESSKVVYEAPPDPKAELRPADYGDTPLLRYMQTRSKERRERAAKKEKRRWREMEAIAEEPKRAKWRCAECGTSKHLEEDPDDRGTFYCTYCWESWESQQAPAPKVKKKKKKSKDADEADAQEETEEVTKKKKKKKDKDREAEEGTSKWRAKDKSGWEEEEDEGEKRHRRKKDKHKARDGEEGEEEEDGERGGKNRWRVKKAEATEESYEDWDGDKRRSKARSSQKGGQDDWWEEEKPSKKSSRSKAEKKSEYAADDSRGSRWRAKAPAAEEGGAAEAEEKPRRKAKDKQGDGGEGGGRWRPKS